MATAEWGAFTPPPPRTSKHCTGKRALKGGACTVLLAVAAMAGVAVYDVNTNLRNVSVKQVDTLALTEAPDGVLEGSLTGIHLSNGRSLLPASLCDCALTVSTGSYPLTFMEGSTCMHMSDVGPNAVAKLRLHPEAISAVLDGVRYRSGTDLPGLLTVASASVMCTARLSLYGIPISQSLGMDLQPFLNGGLASLDAAIRAASTSSSSSPSPFLDTTEDADPASAGARVCLGGPSASTPGSHLATPLLARLFVSPESLSRVLPVKAITVNIRGASAWLHGTTAAAAGSGAPASSAPTLLAAAALMPISYTLRAGESGAIPLNIAYMTAPAALLADAAPSFLGALVTALSAADSPLGPKTAASTSSSALSLQASLGALPSRIAEAVALCDAPSLDAAFAAAAAEEWALPAPAPLAAAAPAPAAHSLPLPALVRILAAAANEGGAAPPATAISVPFATVGLGGPGHAGAAASSPVSGGRRLQASGATLPGSRWLASVSSSLFTGSATSSSVSGKLSIQVTGGTSFVEQAIMDWLVGGRYSPPSSSTGGANMNLIVSVATHVHPDWRRAVLAPDGASYLLDPPRSASKPALTTRSCPLATMSGSMTRNYASNCNCPYAYDPMWYYYYCSYCYFMPARLDMEGTASISSISDCVETWLAEYGLGPAAAPAGAPKPILMRGPTGMAPGGTVWMNVSSPSSDNTAVLVLGLPLNLASKSWKVVTDAAWWVSFGDGSAGAVPASKVADAGVGLSAPTYAFFSNLTMRSNGDSCASSVATTRLASMSTVDYAMEAGPAYRTGAVGEVESCAVGSGNCATTLTSAHKAAGWAGVTGLPLASTCSSSTSGPCAKVSFGWRTSSSPASFDLADITSRRPNLPYAVGTCATPLPSPLPSGVPSSTPTPTPSPSPYSYYYTYTPSDTAADVALKVMDKVGFASRGFLSTSPILPPGGASYVSFSAVSYFVSMRWPSFLPTFAWPSASTCPQTSIPISAGVWSGTSRDLFTTPRGCELTSVTNAVKDAGATLRNYTVGVKDIKSDLVGLDVFNALRLDSDFPGASTLNDGLAAVPRYVADFTSSVRALAYRLAASLTVGFSKLYDGAASITMSNKGELTSAIVNGSLSTFDSRDVACLLLRTDAPRPAPAYATLELSIFDSVDTANANTFKLPVWLHLGSILETLDNGIASLLGLVGGSAGRSRQPLTDLARGLFRMGGIDIWDEATCTGRCSMLTPPPSTAPPTFCSAAMQVATGGATGASTPSAPVIPVDGTCSASSSTGAAAPKLRVATLDGVASVLLDTATCAQQPATAALRCDATRTYVIGTETYAYVGRAADLNMVAGSAVCNA